MENVKYVMIIKRGRAYNKVTKAALSGMWRT